MLLQIKDWNKHFENNRTRELKTMQWVPLPNKQDGDGYRELIEDHKNGVAHYGVWCALVGVASKCDPRGTLLRDNGKPHDYSSLKRKTGIPAMTIKNAVPRLIEIGWLVATPWESTPPQDGAGKSQDGAGKSHGPARNGREGNGREGNGIEGKGTEGIPVPDASQEGTPPALKHVVSKLDSLDMSEKHTDGKTLRYWGNRSKGIVFDRLVVCFIGITDKRLQVWIDACPAVDIHLSINQAAAWVSANKGGKGCKKDYPAFLTNWLSRCQAKGGNRNDKLVAGSILPSEKDMQK